MKYRWKERVDLPSKNNFQHLILPQRKGWFFYSVLKLFTGFAIAAFIAWKLTVINAINITNNPADANSHQLRVMR